MVILRARFKGKPRFVKVSESESESETLFKEETTSLVSDFHVGPPYKNKLITTIIIKYSKYKN